MTPLPAPEKTSHYISFRSLNIRLSDALTNAIPRPRVRRAALRRLEVYAGRAAHR